MRVPGSFKQVTVEQYQEIVPVYKKLIESTDQEIIIDGWVNILAILTDRQTDEFEAMPIPQLKKLIASIQWISKPEAKLKAKKYLFVGGRLHKAQLKAGDFNVAQFIEVKTFLGRGSVSSELHNLLASIYSPLTLKGFIHDGKSHAERAATFKKCKVGKVYPTVFFYSKVYKNLMPHIEAYGLNQVEKMISEISKLWEVTPKENSESAGGGIVRLTK